MGLLLNGLRRGAAEPRVARTGLRPAAERDIVRVDCKIIPPFGGRPDGIFVWFICDSITTRDRFRADALSDATGRLRALAVEAGFPAASAETLRTDVTSNEEIESGGGRFRFFR